MIIFPRSCKCIINIPNMTRGGLELLNLLHNMNIAINTIKQKQPYYINDALKCNINHCQYIDHYLNSKLKHKTITCKLTIVGKGVNTAAKMGAGWVAFSINIFTLFFLVINYLLSN